MSITSHCRYQHTEAASALGNSEEVWDVGTSLYLLGLSFTRNGNTSNC